jgi:hypothetical protein
MYKILLCYAQTHTYIIYIERDCVRDKALLYKKKETNLSTRKGKQIRKIDMRRRKIILRKKR